MTLNLRLGLVLVLVAATTIVLLPFQLASLLFRLPSAGWIPVVWHRITCRAIGIRVECKDRPAPGRPLMLVANHVSWSDILVLGSIAPLTFVAKHEVSRIAGASFLARLQRTVFVVRERRHHSADQARAITERLLKGEIVVLFAEGTTGNGNRLLEFKSALLGSAQYAIRDGVVDVVRIQPVSIRYITLHGVPLGRRQRAMSSWVGDEELGPHLARFVGHGHWDAEVRFGEPIDFDSLSKRREAIAQLRNRVRGLLAEN